MLSQAFLKLSEYGFCRGETLASLIRSVKNLCVCFAYFHSETCRIQTDFLEIIRFVEEAKMLTLTADDCSVVADEWVCHAGLPEKGSKNVELSFENGVFLV